MIERGSLGTQNHLIIRPLDLITPLSPSAMGRSEQPPGGAGTALIKRLADPRREVSNFWKMECREPS